MHPKFLDILCCPETREPLSLQISETQPNGQIVAGVLISPSGRRYPIVRGIPRFVSQEHYTASFGYEWTRWPRVQFESDNVGRPMQGHTTRMWEIITQAPLDAVQDKMVVEFGCGSGRFLDIVRRKGGKAIGIDLSQAVEVARRNFADDPDVLIVQGDILNPPFRDSVFDGGFTIGVLHHLPEPLGGLRSMVRTVRSNGWIACCVYSKDAFYDFRSVARFRWLHRHLKSIFGYRPALAYTYLSAYVLTPLMRRSRHIPGMTTILNYVERNWLVVLDLPDVRWRILDMFDAITPSIATSHTQEEVENWMNQASCKDVHTTSWCDTSLVGTRM